MTLLDTDIPMDQLFSLITSENQENWQKAFPWRSMFADLFQTKWPAVDDNLKTKMLHFAGYVEVEEGLPVILEGIRHHVISVREQAKASLEQMAARITIPFETVPDAITQELSRHSAIFSVRIFHEMKSMIVIEDVRFFLSVLLSIGGHGPAYALRFFINGIVPHHLVVDLIKGFPEPSRLAFVYQYTRAPVSDRLRFGGEIRGIVQGVKDRRLAMDFFAGLFDHGARLDPLLRELGDRLGIYDGAVTRDLHANITAERVRAVKIIGAYRMASSMKLCIHLLFANEPKNIRMTCIQMFVQAGMPATPQLIKALFLCLKENDPDVVLSAFSLLVRYHADGLETVFQPLIEKFPEKKDAFFICLMNLSFQKLGNVLRRLSDFHEKEARETVFRWFVRQHPDRMIQFVKQYEMILDEEPRKELNTLRHDISAIQKQEMNRLAGETLPAFQLQPSEKKNVWDRLANGKQKKITQLIESATSLAHEKFQHMALADLDFSGMHLQNVRFNGAHIENVTFKKSVLDNVVFDGACLKNVTFTNARLTNVSFKKCLLDRVTAHKTTFQVCTFEYAKMRSASFRFAAMDKTNLMHAWLRKVDFEGVHMGASNFVGMDAALVNFRNAMLDHSDFTGGNIRFCDFSGMDVSRLMGFDPVETARGAESLSQLKIPESFHTIDKLKGSFFDMIIMLVEIGVQEKRFLDYNNCRLELAMDSFTPSQRDLFELIPLIVYAPVVDIPYTDVETRKKIRKAPCGIHGYFPSERVIKLFTAYFNRPIKFPTAASVPAVHGLYTIGSVGSIAQTTDSDIDYWVCIDESLHDEDAVSGLKEKLQSIEKWAQLDFNMEVHFFTMDLLKIKEDRFGGSDAESSGSAQGKILKEEFYRTMLLVAGKIPFWHVFPSWLDEMYYRFSYVMASKLNNGYLDFGNVAAIPKGEYFGASIWQLFKSLKSPFKSVMKMALLEKYIKEETSHSLLCNNLKSKRNFGELSLDELDPYILFFKQIITFYRKAGQKDAESLLTHCFLLKIGVEPDKGEFHAVLGVRQKLRDGCLQEWRISEAMIQDLKQFKSWPYKKIVRFGAQIKKYMLDTYNRLSLNLKTEDVGETLITTQDLTILGRKMFVHFARHENKVESLPLILHGGVLFQQVRLRYVQAGQKKAWELSHAQTNSWEKNVQVELIKRMDRIEEIAIWMVHNRLYQSTKSIQLMPNPTPVSPQDFLDLLSKLHRFFIVDSRHDDSHARLSKKPVVQKLFIVVNYCLDRKYEKIHEYAAIYQTTWGEIYCRMFTSKKGLNSVRQAVEDLAGHIGLSMASADIGAFVSSQVKNRLRIGDNIMT